MMRRAVCPGSFDPVTNGHIDVFMRASALFDEVTVGVLVNKKKTSMFSVEERIELLGAELAHVPNIRIDSFHGLLVDYCRDNGIIAIVKGLRAITDFDYELQMAQMNFGLAGIETLFISTNPLYSYLSSSLVKEVATYGGDVSGLIPARVHTALQAKLSAQLISRSAMTQDPVAAADPRTADVYTVLDDLSDIVEAARAMPMSDKCVVNRNEVLDLLDAIRQMLPTSVQEAEELLADRVGVVEEGFREAERMVAEANREVERMLAEGTREAQAIIDQASAQQAHHGQHPRGHPGRARRGRRDPRPGGG